MFEFREIETFVWIARLGSFRAAAEHLGLAQPSISDRIARLEDRLGCRLFDREGRSIRLTRSGRDLLDYAERLLSLRAETIVAITDPDKVSGTMRLGVAETIVHTWLPVLIERLHRQFPSLTLELDVDSSITLRNHLVAHEIDLAFLMGPVSAPAIANKPLCRYPLAWVASPRLALPGHPLSLEELAQWPLITYPRDSKPYHAIQAMLSGLRDIRLRIHGSGSLATIVRMTLDGIGISAIPPRIVAEELAAGTLVLVDTRVELAPLDFTASYARRPDGHLPEVIADIAIAVASELIGQTDRE